MTRAVRCVQPGFILPAVLRDFVRTKVVQQGGADLTEYGQTMFQLDGTDDIWFTANAIDSHVDRDAGDKCMTSGLVLLNDADHRLAIRGRHYFMQPGTAFQIDVSQPHMTVGEDTGLFVFLTWDSYPKDVRPVREFAMEAMFALTWTMRNLGMTS